MISYMHLYFFLRTRSMTLAVPGSAMEYCGWSFMKEMTGTFVSRFACYSFLLRTKPAGPRPGDPRRAVPHLGGPSTGLGRGPGLWFHALLLVAHSARPTKAHVSRLAAELLESALSLETLQCRLQGQSAAPSILRLEDMYQRIQRLQTGAFPRALPELPVISVMSTCLDCCRHSDALQELEQLYARKHLALLPCFLLAVEAKDLDVVVRRSESLLRMLAST